MNYFLCSPTWWTEKFIDYAAVSFNVSPSLPSSNFPMQIALLSLASIWAMYLTLLSILAMPDTKGTWTKRPGTLSFWVFLTRPLLQIHLHPVSCDHSRIESSLGTLRWREPQPPQATAGIKIADTQPCTCWLAGPNKPGSPPPSEDCLFLKYVQKHSWCRSRVSSYSSTILNTGRPW